jgi:predicted nuclease with TOPRIM domain
MWLIDDILKGLPENSLLREKLRTLEEKFASLETEVAILKDDNRKLRTENEKLKNRIEGLTHAPDLHEQEKEILRYLFRSDVDRDLGSIIRNLNFEHPEEAKLRLNNLSKLRYVIEPPRLPIRMNAYRLTDKGREYVLNNLL